MSKFDREMKKAGKKIEDAIEKSIRGVALEMFSEIVIRTPVGNPSLWKSDPPKGYRGGRLRGNWQASIRSPSFTKLEIKDAAGSATIANANRKIAAYDLKDKDIWFSNNLPYADRVENGWSSQRPTGMVRTTVRMFQQLLDKMARKNKI